MACLLTLVFAASAAPITVLNSSFEDVSPALVPSQNTTFSGKVPAAWSFTDVSGVWYPNSFGPAGSSFFLSALAQVTADGGTNVAYSDSGIISQTLSATLQANTLYTLSLEVGDRLDLTNTNTVFSYGLYDLTTNTLLAGEINVSEATAFGGAGVPLKGTFVVRSSNFVSGASGVGDTLGIRLSANDVEFDFDKVSLDGSSFAAAVPLPSSLWGGLLLLAGFGASWVKRRQSAI